MKIDADGFRVKTVGRGFGIGDSWIHGFVDSWIHGRDSHHWLRFRVREINYPWYMCFKLLLEKLACPLRW